MSNCHDIWTKFINLLFCRRNTKIFGDAYGIHGKANQGNLFIKKLKLFLDVNEHNNVLTLVATADGLQLRVPGNNQIQPLFKSNLQQQVLSNIAQHEHRISERIHSVNHIENGKNYNWKY